MVAYRKLNCVTNGHPICYILYNKEPFSTVLLFLTFDDKSDSTSSSSLVFSPN